MLCTPLRIRTNIEVCSLHYYAMLFNLYMRNYEQHYLLTQHHLHSHTDGYNKETLCGNRLGCYSPSCKVMGSKYNVE